MKEWAMFRGDEEYLLYRILGIVYYALTPAVSGPR